MYDQILRAVDPKEARSLIQDHSMKAWTLIAARINALGVPAMETKGYTGLILTNPMAALKGKPIKVDSYWRAMLQPWIHCAATLETDDYKVEYISGKRNP